MNTLTIELPVEGLPSPAELADNFADEARSFRPPNCSWNRGARRMGSEEGCY